MLGLWHPSRGHRYGGNMLVGVVVTGATCSWAVTRHDPFSLERECWPSGLCLRGGPGSGTGSPRLRHQRLRQTPHGLPEWTVATWRGLGHCPSEQRFPETTALGVSVLTCQGERKPWWFYTFPLPSADQTL